MRMHVVASLIIAGAAVALAAPSPATQAEKSGKQPAPAKQTDRPLTLVGCVSGEEQSGPMTFVDEKTGTVYRLSGTNVREYAGKRVQIVEVVDSKRVKVRGGLAPSPNAAAQAGAIDPAQSAMAGQGATTRGVGSGELPEFRVKSVKPVAGGCPPQK